MRESVLRGFRRILTALAAMLAVSTGLGAQTLSLWMLDNYSCSYRVNPSFIPERGFCSLAIGNISPAVSSNLGISNLLFPTSQGLVTGFHDSVSYDEFIGPMKKNNILAFNLNENLLGIGFRGKRGGFTTIELNLRSDIDANIPRGVFAMFKRGGTGTYDLSSSRLRASAYSEIALGYSKKFGSRIAFGARVKGLVGFANARLDVSRATACATADAVSLKAAAELMVSAPFLEYRTKASEYAGGSNNVLDFESLSFNSSRLAPGGYGAALDIGVTFTPLKDLEIGLAFNDLGLIGWQYGIIGVTEADVAYTGEKINLTGSGDIILGGETDAALDALRRLTEIRVVNETRTAVQMLPLNINASLRYRLPFYRRLSVGAMASFLCRGGGCGTAEFRGGVTLTPFNWFSLSCNGGFSTFGAVWGSSFSINAGPLNIWAGFDGFSGSVAHWRSDNGRFSLPYPTGSFSLRPSLGIIWQFGKRHSALKD
ncbi:MAG: DUF5723 family protein [Candidatus Cryptobacteroides sp.]